MLIIIHLFSSFFSSFLFFSVEFMIVKGNVLLALHAINRMGYCSSSSETCAMTAIILQNYSRVKHVRGHLIEQVRNIFLCSVLIFIRAAILVLFFWPYSGLYFRLLFYYFFYPHFVFMWFLFCFLFSPWFFILNINSYSNFLLIFLFFFPFLRMHLNYSLASVNISLKAIPWLLRPLFFLFIIWHKRKDYTSH